MNLEEVGWKGVDGIYVDGNGEWLRYFVNTAPAVETNCRVKRVVGMVTIARLTARIAASVEKCDVLVGSKSA